jgi:hypothetical protein
MNANARFIGGMVAVATICIGICLSVPRIAGSHCDTLDGPVVITAKMVLEKGDVGVNGME